MTPARRFVLASLVCWLGLCSSVGAQDERRVFAGVVAGMSTLSADSRAEAASPEVRVSLYTPKNGPAVNAFAGWHVAPYFSVQGSYVWNRNDLTLVSSAVTATGGAFYEQRRSSTQRAVIADGLIYFRGLDSHVRPYLGTGLAFVRFTSEVRGGGRASGLAPPAGRLTSTGLALRSHVGIDVALGPRLRFRYSFSETIGGNPVSPHLSPPGGRGLANFQNLFGLLAQF